MRYEWRDAEQDRASVCRVAGEWRRTAPSSLGCSTNPLSYSSGRVRFAAVRPAASLLEATWGRRASEQVVRLERARAVQAAARLRLRRTL
eukprot:6554896-Prymnesium_polylepis.1